VAAVADTPSAYGRFTASTGAQMAAASVTRTNVAAAGATANSAEWGAAALRTEQAAAELAYRRDAIVAATRSADRPSFVWPSHARMSGWFGERRGRRGHVGMDLDGETGDPIVAAGAGVVEWVGQAPDGYSGYGQMVLIRHSNNMQTLYAHLSRTYIAHGAIVEAGDYIGAMGTTGHVTGSHLHFEVRLNGAPVNPRDWLPGR
jgi:murein DD-endopeptidase MepM/ murein hydrolase activator NlpD